MFRSVIWSSMLDYPGQVCTVLFVGQCNWSCAYCHNKSLPAAESIDFYMHILPKLLERKAYVNHIIISGGEPTIYKKLPEYIKRLHDEGFTIGLHTNGSNPVMLNQLMPYLSFIGMDIKATPEGYTEHILNNIFTGTELKNIRKSMTIIINSTKQYEFRTTVYDKYTTKQDIRSIALDLANQGVHSYVLQKCNNDFCSTPDNSDIEASASYVKDLISVKIR